MADLHAVLTDPAQLGGGCTLGEVAGALVISSPVNHGYFNRVVRFRWSPGEAEDALDAVLGATGGREFAWMVAPDDTPADLGARLRRRDAGYLGELRVLAAPAGLEVPAPAAEVREVVKPALAAECAELYAHVNDLGAGFASFRACQWAEWLGDGRHRLYAAFAGQRLAGTAAFRLCSGQPLACLETAAVLPEFQGRGLYRALLARRMADAAAAGAAAAVAHCQERSAAILSRAGFRDHGAIGLYQTGGT